MKREKNLRTLTRISLTFLIPAAATYLFVATSCGKTINSGTAEGQAAAPQPSSSTTSPDSAYIQVAEMPVFPDGDNALLKFIAEKTVYPDAAIKNNITGKVIVKFIVEKDCSVSNVTIIKSVDPLLDAEAVRVVSSLPKFETPAKNGGVVVRVYYMVPITFALK